MHIFVNILHTTELYTLGLYGMWLISHLNCSLCNAPLMSWADGVRIPTIASTSFQQCCWGQCVLERKEGEPKECTGGCEYTVGIIHAFGQPCPSPLLGAGCWVPCRGWHGEGWPSVCSQLGHIRGRPPLCFWLVLKPTAGFESLQSTALKEHLCLKMRKNVWFHNIGCIPGPCGSVSWVYQKVASLIPW